MSRALAPGLVFAALVGACAATYPPVAQVESDECGVGRSQTEHQSNAELEACAEGGNPRAQAYLGMLYLGAASSEYFNPTSRGLDPNFTRSELLTEGRRLIESAAQSGNAEAQNELGHAYLEGEYGFEVRTDLALVWLRAATDNGDSIAPYNLARLLFAGRGIAQSLTDGEAYLRLSASRGYKAGRCSLARWLDQYSDHAHQAEARALRDAAARDDYGLGCATHDIMDELPVIEEDSSI